MSLVRWLLETWTTVPCGAGPCPTWLAVLYHVSNLVITICYLTIPAIVLWYWRYRRDGISPLNLWMVLAFLPVQAMSRLARVDGLMGVPMHLIVVLDVLAAIVTVNSVVWLRPKILHLLRLPSRGELHDAKDALQKKVYEIQILHLEEQEKNAKLLAEVAKLRHSVSDPSERSWIQAKHKALDRIVAVIKEGS